MFINKMYKMLESNHITETEVNMKYIVKIGKPKGNNTTRISMPAQIVEQLKLLECDYVEISTDGKTILVEPIRRS